MLSVMWSLTVTCCTQSLEVLHNAEPKTAKSTLFGFYHLWPQTSHQFLLYWDFSCAATMSNARCPWPTCNQLESSQYWQQISHVPMLVHLHHHPSITLVPCISRSCMLVKLSCQIRHPHHVSVSITKFTGTGNCYLHICIVHLNNHLNMRTLRYLQVCPAYMLMQGVVRK